MFRPSMLRKGRQEFKDTPAMPLDILVLTLRTDRHRAKVWNRRSHNPGCVVHSSLPVFGQVEILLATLTLDATEV
jgi:hypothetical protein